MPKAPWLPTTTACWRGSALWPTPPTALDPRGSRGVALASGHVDAVASVGLGAVHGCVRAPHPVVGVDQQAVRLGQSDAQRAVLGGGGFAALFQETRADALGHRARAADVGFGQHDGKLVAAVARRRVDRKSTRLNSSH